MRKQFKQTPHKALLKAIEIVGGQTELARQLSAAENVKIKQSVVHKWANQTGMVPGEYALTIKKLTGGKVTAHQLCPDIFPKGLA